MSIAPYLTNSPIPSSGSLPDVEFDLKNSFVISGNFPNQNSSLFAIVY